MSEERGGERRQRSNHGNFGGGRRQGGPKRRDGFQGGDGKRRDDARGERRGQWRADGDRPQSKDRRKSGHSSKEHTEFRRNQRSRHQSSRPHREGYRQERMQRHAQAPSFPPDISAKDLDPSILEELRSLSKATAEKVAKHMVAAAILMDEDPQLALKHARAAKDLGGRVPVTRETCGIAAYKAGEWKEALSELRAARRMGGGPGLLAVMADCWRGLGQPERAVELAQSPAAAELDAVSAQELAIVVAGAWRDQGNVEQALATMESQDLDASRTDAEAARLFYVYADVLAEAGRVEDARQWFARADAIDGEGLLDAVERIAELEER